MSDATDPPAKKPGNNPEDRWTPGLVAGGYVPVPHSFLDLCCRAKKGGGLGLKATTAMTLLQLMSFKRDGRMPYPAVELLASRLGISQQSVRAQLAALVKRKLIVKCPRLGTSNVYDVTPFLTRLEALQVKAKAKKAQQKEGREAILLASSYQASADPEDVGLPGD